jgi:hypothetical protein
VSRLPLAALLSLAVPSVAEANVWPPSLERANWGRELTDALQVATNASGAGAAVVDLSLGDKSVRVARFTPKIAPVARRGFRTRFRARYTLHRLHARIPVRVVPRRGKARTLHLPMRGCRATR